MNIIQFYVNLTLRRKVEVDGVGFVLQWVKIMLGMTASHTSTLVQILDALPHSGSLGLHLESHKIMKRINELESSWILDPRC